MIVASRLCVIYVREDNDSSVQAMITRLIWTTWTLLSAVRERLLNSLARSLAHSLARSLTHSLTHPPTSYSVMSVYGQSRNQGQFQEMCQNFGNAQFYHI